MKRMFCFPSSFFCVLLAASALVGVGCGGSSSSTTPPAPAPIAPPPPANLAATPGNAQVALTWSASTGATYYNVYSGTVAGGESLTPTVTGITGTSYTIAGLANGMTYYYVVAAANDRGTSGPSNEAPATPRVPAPTASPTDLTATAGNALVNLTWSASAGATSYNVYLGTAAGEEGSTPIATGITGTSYTDTVGLVNGTEYFYTVAAVNTGSLASGFSNEVSATPSSALPPTAVRANDFLNTIGVVVHGFGMPGGNDPVQGASLVKQLGIRHIRDSCQYVSGSNLTQCESTLITVYQNSGATFDVLTQSPNGQSDLTQQLNVAVTLANAGALLSVEGPNEIWMGNVTWNGQTSSTSTTFLPAADFQSALYSQSQGTSVLTNYPVFDLTGGGDQPDNVGLQYLVIPSGAGTTMPDGTVYGNYANVHNYIDTGDATGDSCGDTFAANWAWDAFSPTLQGCWDGLWYFYGTAPGYFPAYTDSQLLTLPRVDTENGIAEGDFGFSDAQIGETYLNLFLDAVKEGWSYAFIYDLYDDGAYGLVNGDGSLRTQATYLQNFTTILADTSSNFTPGTLNYSVENEPATVHDLLLQKSNGTFYVAVWDEEVPGSGTTDPVTVNLGGSYNVAEYDPTQGTSPVDRLTDVPSVTLTLSESPMLLQLSAQSSSASNGGSNHLHGR